MTQTGHGEDRETAKSKVEELVERLRSELKDVVEEVSVEWASSEATITLSLGDYLYVMVIIPWIEEEFHMEIVVGDENGVIQPHHIDRMDSIAYVVKRVGAIARELGILK